MLFFVDVEGIHKQTTRITNYKLSKQLNKKNMSSRTNRSTARLSRVQQIQAEEEQMQRQAIKDNNRQAYIARAQRRNQRKVPDWVRERDAQRRATDAKKMEAGEFVIHTGSRRNRSRRNRPSLADHLPKKETKVVPTVSRWAALESDSDEEVQEDYPQLAAPTKKILTPLGNWAAMASKPAAKVAPVLERQCADEKTFAETHGMSFQQQRPAPISTPKIHPEEEAEKDNSAWSDDEDTGFEVASFKKDPSCYNADGTMKSWADLCDSDEEDW